MRRHFGLEYAVLTGAIDTCKVRGLMRDTLPKHLVAGPSGLEDSVFDS